MVYTELSLSNYTKSLLCFIKPFARASFLEHQTRKSYREASA